MKEKNKENKENKQTVKEKNVIDKKRRSPKSNPKGTAFDFGAFAEYKKEENKPQIKKEKKLREKNEQPIKQERVEKQKKPIAPKNVGKKKRPVKVIFLGGVGEIGKNMTAL